MNKYYGRKPGVITKQEKEHTELARDIAARGMVLLENNGILPLKDDTSVALYGYGARHTVFCGLGAASFTSREEVSIEEGLERAGITVTSKNYLERYSALIQAEEDAYYSIMREAAKDALINGVLKMYEEPLVPAAQPIITEEDIRDAAADIAIYVISRVAGEDADRKMTKGDYLLSDEECRNLRILSDNYKNLIVLLNVGGPMDTSFIRSLPNLGALLMVGQAAGVTGLAVADVLTGIVTPEGKLVDTWAEKYDDYPNAETFAAMNGNLDDEFYSEGIYVGYRYFDTFGVIPAYRFGYGLSYTDFSICTENVQKEGENLLVEAEVTNTGDLYVGREVVQVYVSAPCGELEKPYQELKGFTKTDLLNPGEKQKIQINISLRSLACYSEKMASWILEPGDYLIRVGNSSGNTYVAAVVKVEETIICEKCRNLCLPDCEFEELSREGIQLDFNSSINTVYIKVEDIPCIYNEYRDPLWENEGSVLIESTNQDAELLQLQDVLDGRISLDAFTGSLTIEEMSYLCVGNAGEKDEASIICSGGGSSNIDAIVSMAPGTCDSTRELIESRGIPNMHMSDGGSGLRMLPQYEVDPDGNLLTDGILSVRNVDKILGKDYINDRVNNTVYEQYTTGLPMATMLAQTWDTQLCGKCGEIIAKEMQTFHVELWLAPSMNIHRNPLCGRNFEYYSEDPLVTGECATAVINALQSFRCVGVTMKHFACNNQEDNRHGTNAHVSERTLREIYLKGYEIAVRNAHPAAIMSSYNLINGIHSANHYELLTLLARDEWGFDGMVMTDWGTTSQEGNDKRKYKASTCAGCIRAGNDLIMPGSHSDVRNLYASVKAGEVTISELRLCAKRILKTMIRLEAGRS